MNVKKSSFRIKVPGLLVLYKSSHKCVPYKETSTWCQESQIAIFVKKKESSLDISSSFQNTWKVHGQSKQSYPAAAKLTPAHSSTRITSPYTTCNSGIQHCKLPSQGTFHLYDGVTNCSKVRKQLTKFLVSGISNLVHSQPSTIIPGIFICFHNCFNTTWSV